MRWPAAFWLAASALMLSACSGATGADSANAGGCRQDYPALTGRVVDGADVLTSQMETELTAKVAEFERRTGHQLVIASTASLQGKTVDDYALCLARHWAIGRKGKDDGVMLLLAPNERKARIEVGYGLETKLRDDEAKAILDTKAIPLLSKQDYARGIAVAADAIIQELS